MLLYFTNNSKQKNLIKTDYIEDVYDEIIAFFEDYKIRPHFIKVENFGAGCKITWNSQTEMFVCEDVMAEEIEELKDLLEGAHNV